MNYYDETMADFYKTALLLVEQTSRLPQNSERRARLLGLAKGMRQIALEEAEKRHGEVIRDDGPAAATEEELFAPSIKA